MRYVILLVKETKNEEQRVSLIPKDVTKLINDGHSVFVESGAGNLSGFTNDDYVAAGASIRATDTALTGLFNGIQLIVRAKRPNRNRETQENRLLTPGMIMLGALDPFEKNSSHIAEYKQAGIKAYSIDQLNLPTSDPMNILASMSVIAGKLALQDALSKVQRSPAKCCVIIGAGSAGIAAMTEALAHNMEVTVIISSSKNIAKIKQLGATPIVISPDLNLPEQQNQVANLVRTADIIITTARKAKQPAPLLIPETTLALMQRGACIVDLAIAEGGNVAGSQHDQTLILGPQKIIVTNVSGYPKSQPRLASEKWSQASYAFINRLSKNPQDDVIESARIV